MTSIGNKFSALSINVENPFDQLKKKSKLIKKKEHKKMTSVDKKTVESQTYLKEKDRKADNIAKKENQPKKSGIIITDVPNNAHRAIKKSDDQTRSNVSQPHKKIDIKIISSETQTQEATKEKTVTFDAQTDEHLVSEDFEKDDRAVHGRSTYRKMIAARGRVYERHGGPKSHVKAVEKKQGHGAFNWGDTNIQEDEFDDSRHVPGKTSEENPLKQSTAKTESEPKVERPQYTLEQYKEMLRENKVDPFSWTSEIGEGESKEGADDFDVRQYEFRRHTDKNRRGSGRGRGERSDRGGRGRPEYSQRGRGRGYHQQKRGGALPSIEVKVDDVKDFPTL